MQLTVTDILLLAIFVEATVELFFTAAPLQGARSFLIKNTPSLRSEDRGHLLDCKYCTTLWIAALTILLAAIFDHLVFVSVASIIILARVSNYIHAIFSIIRDITMNLRLSR